MSIVSVKCLIENICNFSSYSTPSYGETTARNNDLLGNSDFFRILLPMVLVMGVFIIIVLILLLQKIVMHLLQKTCLRRVDQTRPRTERAAPERQEETVQTITQTYGVLPTYMQVMETIDKGEAPPPYHQVAIGRVNYSFSNARNDSTQIDSSQSHVTSNAENRSRSKAKSIQVYDITNENESSTPDRDTNRSTVSQLNNESFIEVPSAIVVVGTDMFER